MCGRAFVAEKLQCALLLLLPPFLLVPLLELARVRPNIRYLTVEHLRPSLHGPLTGAVTHVPPLPHACCVDDRWEQNLCGAVYADGTTLLYGISTVFLDAKTIASFTAVLLRPGDAE